MSKLKIVFDIECYSNYFLVMFKNPVSGKTVMFESHNDSGFNRRRLLAFVRRYTLVGFNSTNYDCLILRAAIGGFNNAQLKKLSDMIITSGQPHWIIERKVDIPRFEFDHIDLMEPAPGVGVGLKLYGGRMFTKKLQDLPIEPSALIDESDLDLMRKYCENDLDLTAELLEKVKGAIALREKISEQYEIDLRSKSDAQIAEAIIKQYLEKEGVRVGKRRTEVKPFKYRVPDWVSFSTPEMKEALQRVKDAVFTVSDKNKPIMPKELNKVISFGGANYKFGIGGLHSQEKKQVVIPNDDQEFYEEDVGAMYPSIILEQKLYPEHLTSAFLKVYRRIYDYRFAAKKRIGELLALLKDDPNNAQLTQELEEQKTIDSAYKILLNGSYGKFGSHYSYLFSPELLIQTTITGQLSLLMLVERLTLAGMEIKSANTDGINILRKKDQWADAEAITLEWELATGYQLEQTPYAATYNRDVNSYLAITKSGKIKGKGHYADPSLMKNAQTPICIDAIRELITKGTPIEQTITECKEPARFCTIRTVNGGATKDGELLGRIIRWYYAKGEQGAIHYKTNGNKVPKSDGAKPMMNLPDAVPNDLDYEWYIDETKTYLADLGVKIKDA